MALIPTGSEPQCLQTFLLELYFLPFRGQSKEVRSAEGKQMAGWLNGWMKRWMDGWMTVVGWMSELLVAGGASFVGGVFVFAVQA